MKQVFQGSTRVFDIEKIWAEMARVLFGGGDHFSTLSSFSFSVPKKLCPSFVGSSYKAVCIFMSRRTKEENRHQIVGYKIAVAFRHCCQVGSKLHGLWTIL